MVKGKRGDNSGKKELSHYKFIVGVLLFIHSLFFGKFSFKKLVSHDSKLKKIKIEAEHVFVFFAVLFFLGFILIQHTVAGSEFFETSVSEWEGVFSNTTTDGENITLLNGSLGLDYSWLGNYTSSVLDSGQLASWENISWNELNQSELDNISMEYRTSNDNFSWNSWTEISNGYGLLNDSARYFQYRSTLATNDTTITPYLQDVNVTYNKIPLINYINPTLSNNSYINETSIYVNASVEDEDEDTFTINFNDTLYYFTNSTHEYNFENLGDGNYSIYAYVNDSRNQTNYTDIREIVVDLTPPSEFNLTSPENASQTDDNTPTLTWDVATDEVGIANYTIEFSNQSDFGYINATYYSATNSFSNLTELNNATWYWRVLAYDLAGNNNASEIFSFTVASGGTIIETVTETVTVSGGGGTSKKPYSLDIVAPPTITLYSNDEITIPIIIRNPGRDFQLNNIDLSVVSDNGELIGFLDTTNIATLAPGKEAIVNLRLITSALRLLEGQGNFGLTITANVANPAFTDSIKIFANVIDVNSENRTTTYAQIQAAHRLFEGNPECIDLSELLDQADEALNNNEFDKAHSLSKGAIDACNQLIELRSEGKIKLPFIGYVSFDDGFDSLFALIPEDTIIIALEIIGFGTLSIFLIKYLRGRKGKKSSKNKIEAEHVFVFFMVMFFLGFMFLDYSLGLQEFFQTNNTDWTGEFWQTQSDGENITLAPSNDTNYLNVNADKFQTPAGASSYMYDVVFDDSDNTLWVLDRNTEGAFDVIYHVDRQGNNLSGSIGLDTIVPSGFQAGLTFNGSDFWIENDQGGSAEDYVFHINKSGNNITTGFDPYDNFGCSSPNGITYDTRDGTLWMVCATQAEVYHIYTNGSLITNWDIAAAGATGEGIAFDDRDNTFWVSDLADIFVYHFDENGNNITGGFNISEVNIPQGITLDTTDYSFWVSSRNDDYIWHYDHNYLFSEGNYTSNVLDATTQARWENITWTNTSTENISMEFRTSQDNISYDNWIAVANGYGLLNDSARYFQYRAYLNTSDTSYTPYLQDVNVTYNIAPTIPELNKPDNNSFFDVVPELNWSNSTDLDNDDINYYLEIDNDLDFINIIYANNSIAETDNITGDVGIILPVESPYYWRVLAYDTNNLNSSWSEIRKFVYDVFAPNFTIDYPVNGTIYSTVTNFSFSFNEPNLDSCWYQINNSGVNVTIDNCASFNYSDISVEEFYWANITLWLNDTTGKEESNFTEFFYNELPVANTLNIVPEEPWSRFDFRCEFNITDTSYDYLEVNVTWFKDGVAWLEDDEILNVSSGDIYYTNDTGKIEKEDTAGNEVWDCAINVYDGVSWSDWSYSSNSTIGYTSNESIDTSNANWAGEFWRTQSDGENITLAPISLPNNDANDWVNMANNVVLFHFDNNYTNDNITIDNSGDNNNGVISDGFQNLTEAPTYLPNGGVVGGALDLDGDDDYISIGTSSTLNVSTTATIALWFKPGSQSDATPALISQGGLSSFFTLRFDPGLAFQDYEGGYRISTSAINFTRDTWNYIAFTCDTDANTWEVYLNGNSYENGTHSAIACLQYGSPLTLGEDVLHRSYNATIDEFALWNRVLSDSEISDIYNAQKDGFYFSEGNYTSDVIDAERSARWENISWTYDNYTSAPNISLEYRTSQDNTSWDNWIEVSNGYGLLNDSAQYFQYRAYLNTSDTAYTPYLQDVNVTYILSNIAPYIPLLDTPENDAFFSLSNNNIEFKWFNASDADTDNLDYFLYIDGESNQTLQESENVSIIISSGTHNWSIIADDNQVNTSSEVRTFTINTPPTTPSINLNSTDGYNLTNVSLIADFTLIDDVDAHDLVYNISWIKNNVVQFSYENVSNITMLVNEELTNANTTKGETWKVNLTVCDIPYNECGSQVSSNEILILNAIPTQPALILPENNSYITNQTIFYVENSSDIDNDNLNYYWEVDNNIDFSSVAYANTSISETTNATQLGTLSIADGTYWWRVSAYDDEDNTSWSEIRNFTLDSTFPSIVLDNPVNGSSVNNNPSVQGSVTQVNLTITDTNIDSVWWSNDSGLNNYTDLTGSNDINITLDLYPNEMTLNLTIWANDSADNVQEKLYTFILDSTAPIFEWISPEANEVIHDGHTINLTATDALSEVDTLSVWFNGSAVNYTMNNDVGTEEYYYFWDTAGGDDGQYTIIVYGNDTANNLREESRYITVDNTEPTVALETPVNNSHTNLTSITFSFIPNDVHDIDNCSLMINDEINETITGITKGSSNSISISLTHGVYDWNINCTDQENNYGGNESNFVLDVNLVPLIDYISPTLSNNTYINETSIYVNASVEDEDEDTFTINFNDTLYEFTNSTHEYNFSELGDGNYSIYAYVNDSRNQTNYTDTRKIVVDLTLPSEFNLTSPENLTNTEDRSPVLIWQESTDASSVNYTIEFSNQSDFGYINATYYSATNSFSNYENALTNDSWYWRVTALDQAGNTRRSDVYKINIAASGLVTETVTQTVTVTSGGGGGSKKPYALNIIAPPTVSLYSEDEITVPIVIKNNAKDINLNNIDLTVLSESGEIVGFLDITNIAQLLPGKDFVVNLRLITSALRLLGGEGNFGLTITANVANPQFTDSIRIFANVIDVNSENRTTTLEEIEAAHKLFDGYSECKDLEILLEQADEALNNNQYDKAHSLARGAISACKDILSLERADEIGRTELPFGIYLPFDINQPFEILDRVPRDVQIVALEIVGLGVVLVGLLKYLRNRRFRNKKGQFGLSLLFFLVMPSNGGKKKSFEEIRIRMIKTLAENKKQTLNELAKNSGLCWRTVKTHIIYLKGKGLAKEVLDTPYVKIFEITEKGEEESKLLPSI